MHHGQGGAGEATDGAELLMRELGLGLRAGKESLRQSLARWRRESQGEPTSVPWPGALQQQQRRLTAPTREAGLSPLPSPMEETPGFPPGLGKGLVMRKEIPERLNSYWKRLVCSGETALSFEAEFFLLLWLHICWNRISGKGQKV